MATAKKVPPTVRTPPDLKQRISDAGFFATDIVRTYAPFDSGDPCEVLFIGYERGYKDRGRKRPLTAWLPDEKDEEPKVSEGWTGQRPEDG